MTTPLESQEIEMNPAERQRRCRLRIEEVLAEFACAIEPITVEGPLTGKNLEWRILPKVSG